ncbi:MAG: CoA protein activase [Syntrophomonadaceae bacterium]|nr:CoA protein activase [Syntrophomonadaceae bacterium]
MKITFPHMGNMHIAIKSLLEGLRLEVIPPPPISKKTLELGIKHSPEFACMPLKINIGNFIEALDRGADTIIMAGGWGPCRFGYYAQVEREILNDLGYKFNMVVLEAPDSKLSELLKQIKALGENVSFWEFIRTVKYAWHKLNAVEELERKLEHILPRTTEKDKAEQIYEQGLVNIDKARNRNEVDKAVVINLEAMDKLPRHGGQILKIGLIGEIYTILEPSANYNIANYIARLNAEVTRSIYTSEWVNDHLLGGLVKKSNHRYILKTSKPYLNYAVGGHGRETVGNAVNFAREKYDGIVQIGPLTCMPEIVAQSVLGQVSSKENIPCMTLWFDEHSGTAGINTRLEAFIDMLRRKGVQQAVAL